jgi:hypothetical protein
LDLKDFAHEKKKGKAVLERVLNNTLRKIKEAIGEIQPCYGQGMVITYINL